MMCFVHDTQVGTATGTAQWNMYMLVHLVMTLTTMALNGTRAH